MNSEENFQKQETTQEEQKSNVLTSVTPLSKYLAMILFVVMPFIGGYIGYKYSPEKVVYVEKVIVTEVVKEKQIENDRLPYQEFFIENDIKFEVFVDHERLSENVGLIGTDFCPAPEMVKVDLSLEIPGQRIGFSNVGVPDQVADLWPKVPNLINTGMAMYENEDFELLPAMKIGDNTIVIPDYSTLSVVELENEHTVEGKECEYTFEEFIVVYFHEDKLIEDTRIMQPKKLSDIINSQLYYSREGANLRPFCFGGCG